MKIKLLALLKTSFASKGFSQKELEEWAGKTIDLLSLTDTSTDEDLTAAVTRIAPIVDLTQSIASRQVSDAVKPKIVEVAKVAETVKTDVVADVNETPTEKLLKQALAGITALTAEVATIKGEKVATTREAEFTPLLKDASPSYKKTMLQLLQSKSALSDEDYAAWLEGTKTDVAEHVQEVANSGLGVERPMGGLRTLVGGKKEASADEVEALASAII